MEKTNDQLTRALHENFSSNMFEQCVEMAAPDVKITAHALGMTYYGREAFGQFMAGFKQAFPDMVIHHENLVVDGKCVSVQFTATGIHSGPLQTPAGDIPPSGKKVTLHVAEFLEWENGMLTSLTNYQDSGSLMRQIGVM